MPLGDLNEAKTFISMTMKLQIEWDILAEEIGLKIVTSTVIVDYVLLHGRTKNQLLYCFRTVLGVLKHHHITLKL